MRYVLGLGLPLIAVILALLTGGLLLPVSIPMFLYGLKQLGVKLE